MKKKNSARALVAHHVRRLRREAGLSQELLATKCGFHRTYISQVERQATNITVDNLERLAEVLGVAPAQLLEAS
jgi:transcriptional regulator with XRE-family HTH domain